MAGIEDFLHTGGALKGDLARDALDHAAGLRLLRAGDRVGPFRIRDELGRGGMGVVYEAERVDGAYEQRVAIKWLLARGDVHLAQFRRERQILAALRHPHIARLLDGGETSDGMLWFAMERIEGRPIDRYCAEQGIGLRERVALFEQVCEAIAFAHARLLVHRDIKPSNILVDSDGSAKLVDFGIAHVLDGSDAVDAYTPGFASPEQASGAPSSIAGDIYSLGALLRRLLHPRVEEAIDGDAVPPGSMGRDAPELDAIADRAAADSAEQRYATVEALLDDLKRQRRHFPVAAFGGGAGYRARKFLRRHWAAAGVGMVATILIAVLSVAFVTRLRGERDHAELEARKANAVTGFVVDLLRSADPAVHRGEKLSVLEVIAGGERKADLELAGQPDVHARLLGTLADVQLSLSNYRESLRMNERAVAILRTLPATPPQQIVQRLRNAAQSAYRLDEFEHGLALIDEAQAHHLGATRDAYTAVSLLRTRASLLAALDRDVEGEQAAIAAVRTAREELPPGSPILGRALIGAALYDEARDDYGRALDKAREAAAIFAAAPEVGVRHPDSFVARGNMALYLFNLNQPKAALDEIEANLGVMGAVTGVDHARYTRQAGFAARVALALGDTVRARHWLDIAREGLPRVQHLGHQAWMDVALAEGELALRESRPRDALRWFERLDSAAGGKEPDAEFGLIRAHCQLGRQAFIQDRIDRLANADTSAPRQALLRKQLRTLCQSPRAKP